MKFHSIIHAPFETVGAIDDWIKTQGYTLTETHSYRNETLPTPSEFDCLIVMGGPQSPTEIDIYPYLSDEITLIQDAIVANKKIIGFCLGAQLIAEALGAKTLRSPYKEIGIYPIALLSEAKKDPFFSKQPQQFDVLHWHNDMPGIPQGSTLLAKSDGCPNQAFRYGDRIYGFQFHMEPTLTLIRGMIEHCTEDLDPGKYIMSKEELLSGDYQNINHKLFQFLSYLAQI